MRILLVAALLALTACQAQRTLVVTSQPPGALVRVDGIDYGATPVEIPFLYYGTRRVSLNLDGYLSYSEVIKMQPPWYGFFPIDFFSEILLPVGWKDRHEVNAVLKLGEGTIPAPELADVLERAEELRRAGPEGPAPDRPVPDLDPDADPAPEPTADSNTPPPAPDPTPPQR